MTAEGCTPAEWGRLGEKQRQHPGKSQPRAGHADERLLRRHRAVHENGGGGALFGAGEEPFILGEGQVAGLGAVRRGEPLHDQGGIADDFAADMPGNFRNGERHNVLGRRRPARLRAHYTPHNLSFNPKFPARRVTYAVSDERNIESKGAPSLRACHAPGAAGNLRP
jgi:hypothetical protein